MDTKKERAKRITHNILAMCFVVYGIVLQYFLIYFDGDYQLWARIVNSVPVGASFVLFLIFFIMDIRRQLELSDLIYNLAAGFAICSGISVFMLSFLLHPFAGVFFSLCAILPFVIYIIDLIVWKRSDDGEQERQPDIGVNKIWYVAVAVLAAIVFVTLMYVVIESSVKVNMYNLVLTVIVIPIVAIPFIIIMIKAQSKFKAAAFLFGTTMGLCGFCGSTPILNYSLSGACVQIIGAILFYALTVAFLTAILNCRKSKREQ